MVKKGSNHDYFTITLRLLKSIVQYMIVRKLTRTRTNFIKVKLRIPILWKRTIENREHCAICKNPSNRGTEHKKRNDDYNERSETKTNPTVIDQIKLQVIR